MKKFKIVNLLLIILLSILLSLSGCKAKQEKVETPGSTDQEQQISQEDNTEEQDIEEDHVNVEEQEEEEQAEQTEETPDVKEEETSPKSKEPEKKPEPKEDIEKTPEETKDTLKIEGKVTNELALSLSQLKDMKDIIFTGNYYSINNFGTTNHTKFKGVNLWSLLNEKAKISSDATKVAIIAVDGYKMEFTIDQVKRQDYIDETNPDLKFPIIIAWEENDQEYDSEEGPPFKLVIGQKEEGDVNKPQWVSNIDKINVE